MSDMVSFNALLPNLFYKNKNIYFKPKNPIKTTINGKIKYNYQFLLNNISLTGKIYCLDIELNCIILEKEDKDGLLVNIKFRDNLHIYKKDMQKFARAVEASILGIDLMDDNETNIRKEYENEYSSYAHEMYNNPYSDIDEESKISDNYEINEDYDISEDCEYTNKNFY
jgi:hypothetical protein